MVAALDLRASGSATISAPAGWTLIRRDSNTPGYAALSQALYYRVAGSSEAGSYRWTFSSSTAAAGAIASFSGVDTTNPIDAHSGAFVPKSKSITAPSVTTTAASDAVVGFFATSGGRHITPASGTTEAYDIQGSGGGNVTTAEAATAVQANAGATGNKTAFSQGGQSSSNLGQLVALKAQAPASVPAPPATWPAPDTSVQSWVDSDSPNIPAAGYGYDEENDGSEGTQLSYTVANADGTECSLDGAAYSSCYPSPWASVRVPADALPHTLAVRATRNSDGAVDDTPAVVELTVCPYTNQYCNAGSSPQPPVSAPAPGGNLGSVLARPSCTIWASPTGGGSGGSETSPTTLDGAYRQTVPGSTVCLMPGTYNRSSEFTVSRGGSAEGGYITYRSCCGGTATLQATASFGNLVQTFASYVQFMDLVLDGNNGSVSNGLHVNYTTTHTDHNRAINLVVRRTGAGGIVTAPGTDYFTAYGNQIYRFGDVGGWSSGISFHNGNGAYWADTAPGFHNIIVGNIITGGIDNSSYNSDGNGIMEDLGGDVPPTLIANNVVYMNGGRCIHSLQISGKQYILNNTCYKNGLDTRKTWDEFRKNQSTNAVIANNIAQGWHDYTYNETNGTNTYIRNYESGGLGKIGLPTGAVVLTGDPLFVAPPKVDSSAPNQWQNPPMPSSLGDALHLQAGSLLVDTAVDPRTLPGLDSTMLAQIGLYVMTDADGVSRPQGAGFDYGAYER